MRLVLEQAAIFSGAFLLFQIQPMMGRFLLPWFGGSPSVWTVCLLFFQLLLLAGYAWAHLAAGSRTFRWLHWALLAASVAAVWSAAPQAPGETRPTLGVLRVLASTIGLPYFVLSTASPLIQRFSHAPSPYRLYALSNAGALLGLLSYPFVIEPLWGLARQWRLWTCAYTVFCVAYAILPRPVTRESASGAPSNWLWVAAASSGSMLLLAATNQMTQEVAATPFLWVLPLAIYLLTFILAFASARFYRPALFAGLAALTIPVACMVKAVGLRAPLAAHIVANGAVLFVCAMICHGELARSRPDRGGLTRFYLWIAAGGALGGALVAFLAPQVFTNFAEFELALAAPCLLLLPAVSRSMQRLLILAALIAAATVLSGGEGATLAANRSFFGLLRVSGQEGRRSLSHGRVTHGYQFQDQARRGWPTAYYGPESGLGIAMRTLPHPLRAGVIGLGVGTAASYGQPGDVVRFYEINPAVERFAREYFTYLKDSRARVEVELGDARLDLTREPPQSFDLLAVDAFSSDSIPAHLLTAEAAEVYHKHLKPGGVLLFHITNQYLDLEPVVRGMAARIGWPAYRVDSPADAARGVSASSWMIVTKNGALAGVRASGPAVTWTDDRISLWKILR